MDNNIIDKRFLWEVYELPEYLEDTSDYDYTQIIDNNPENDKWIANVQKKEDAAFIVKACNEYDTLKEQNKKLNRLLHDLTPGGSEFYENPEYCAKWIKEHIGYLTTMYKNLKKKQNG